MSNDILLKSDIFRIAKIITPTKAEMFGNLKVGDRIKFSIAIQKAGRTSRHGTMASYIKATNIETKECAYFSFNQMPSRLSSFELIEDSLSEEEFNEKYLLPSLIKPDIFIKSKDLEIGKEYNFSCSKNIYLGKFIDNNDLKNRKKFFFWNCFYKEARSYVALPKIEKKNVSENISGKLSIALNSLEHNSMYSKIDKQSLKITPISYEEFEELFSNVRFIYSKNEIEDIMNNVERLEYNRRAFNELITELDITYHMIEIRKELGWRDGKYYRLSYSKNGIKESKTFINDLKSIYNITKPCRMEIYLENGNLYEKTIQPR